MNKCRLNKMNTVYIQGRLIPIHAIYGKINNVYYYIDSLRLCDNKHLSYIWIYDNITNTIQHDHTILPARWKKVYFTSRSDRRLKEVFLLIQNYIVPILQRHEDWQSLHTIQALGYNPMSYPDIISHVYSGSRVKHNSYKQLMN